MKEQECQIKNFRTAFWNRKSWWNRDSYFLQRLCKLQKINTKRKVVNIVITIKLNDREVKDLIFACSVAMYDRCITRAEEKPFQLLINKLEKGGE